MTVLLLCCCVANLVLTSLPLRQFRRVMGVHIGEIADEDGNVTLVCVLILTSLPHYYDVTTPLL